MLIQGNYVRITETIVIYINIPEMYINIYQAYF